MRHLQAPGAVLRAASPLSVRSLGAPTASDGRMRWPADGTFWARTTTHPPVQPWAGAGSTKLPVNTAPAANTNSSPGRAAFSAACKSAPEATATVRVDDGMVTSGPDVGSVAGVARTHVPGALAVVTVTAPDPTIPLTDAMIVAEPAAMPVMVPDEEIVANVAPDVTDHETDAVLTTRPLASRAVAVADVVCPTEIDGEFTATDTDATGPAAGDPTDRVVEPEIVPLMAMTCTVPTANVVATPLDDITITDGFELCQVIAADGTGVPDASRAVAVA